MSQTKLYMTGFKEIACDSALMPLTETFSIFCNFSLWPHERNAQSTQADQVNSSVTNECYC